MKSETTWERLKRLGAFRKPQVSDQDPFNIYCNEVIKHLKTYWSEPSKLASSLLARISMHLKECEECQEAFVKIMDENPIK